MKQFILASLLFIGVTFSFAGNGDPSCNCNSNDQVNIFAAGTAVIVNSNQVQCNGTTGTCWEVTFKPGGGWVLTIYTDPILTFGNSNSQGNPPQSPYEINRTDGSVFYTWDIDIWKKK
jgi:hypothetical protein